MVAISLRASQHPGFKQLDAVALEGAGPLPGLGANVRSLADSTGIPTETVRRKIQQLVADWVVRDGRNLRYSAEGDRAVAPARDSIIRMCVRGFEEIRAAAQARVEDRILGEGLGKQALVDMVDRVVAELLQLLDFNDVQKLQSLVCHLASYQRTPSRLATNGRS